MVSRSLAAAAALSLLLTSTAARADAGMSFGPIVEATAEALREMRFWSQGEIGAAGAITDWHHPGGVSLRGSISLEGFGLATALRYERIAGAHGGVFALGGRFRPLAFAHVDLYRRFDPFLGIGGEIGGDQAGFRAAGTVSGGFDLALFGDTPKMHPALTFEYELRPLRFPSATPLQILHIGGAFRGVF
jgi:hypothetical protein